MKLLNFFMSTVLIFGQQDKQYIDGVAAVIEEHIVLKSDLAQMVNMAAVQNGINPKKDIGSFLKLQETVLGSMVDQKILLEMAEVDSITVGEKEVDQSLEQQIQMLVLQAGGESQAVEVLGQSLSDFRREFWYDMRDRLVSEKYQQQLLNNVSVTRDDVVAFFKTYKDSLPTIPTKTKIRHLLVPIEASNSAKEASLFLLTSIKEDILSGGKFEDLAKTHSQDPGSSTRGGSLGWVNRGSLVKRFETAAFTARVGDIVGPVETEFGFHLIETLEKKGDKIKVRHILSIPEKTNEDNKRAFDFAGSLKRDSIKTIDDFKTAVKRHTFDESTKKIGGDLGWIDPSNYAVPEIGQAINIIGMDSCSAPINSSLGFHLLWFEGIKRGGRPNTEDHWPEIESMALNKKKMDWYQNWISDARKLFFIKVFSG
jgi:peptidyl-prolyl cis-trans isomerase SurA